MVYAHSIDRHIFRGGIHSHRQNDYCKRGVADEDPYAGLYPFCASIGLALSGKEVAGILLQHGGMPSHYRCADDYSPG